MRVGMNRINYLFQKIADRVPHACGDEPAPRCGVLETVKCYPRVDHRQVTVFPMRVGMNRERGSVFRSDVCVPHACGDEPTVGKPTGLDIGCSPCVWG